MKNFTKYLSILIALTLFTVPLLGAEPASASSANETKAKDEAKKDEPSSESVEADIDKIDEKVEDPQTTARTLFGDIDALLKDDLITEDEAARLKRRAYTQAERSLLDQAQEVRRKSGQNAANKQFGDKFRELDQLKAETRNQLAKAAGAEKKENPPAQAPGGGGGGGEEQPEQQAQAGGGGAPAAATAPEESSSESGKTEVAAVPTTETSAEKLASEPQENSDKLNEGLAAIGAASQKKTPSSLPMVGDDWVAPSKNFVTTVENILNISAETKTGISLNEVGAETTTSQQSYAADKLVQQGVSRAIREDNTADALGKIGGSTASSKNLINEPTVRGIASVTGVTGSSEEGLIPHRQVRKKESQAQDQSGHKKR